MLKRDIYVEELKSGMTAAEIAEKHGVSRSTIYNAVDGLWEFERKEDIGLPECDGIHEDCIMFRNGVSGKQFCSALKELYCGVEKCKFYKPKEGKK